MQHDDIDHTGVTGVPAALSYASNANAVSSVSAAGASTLVSRADHVHDGVRSISHTSNTFDGPVTFTASGSLGITSPSAGTLNFSAVDTTGGGSSVTIQTFHGCSIFHSTTAVNPSAVAFDSENYDTDGYHSTVTNTTRVTIPAGLGGYYNVSFSSLVTANCTVRLRKGGSTIIGPNNLMVASSYGHYNVTVLLAAGDYIEMAVVSNATFGHASAYEAQSQMTVSLIGA